MALERITQALIRPGAAYVYLAWIVKDARGAMHFHFDVSAEIHGLRRVDIEDAWGRAGVETHWALPPRYMRGQAASHDLCEILGAPCWHSGTSLWASEHWMPNVRRFGTEWIWSALESRHAETFDHPKDDVP